MATVHLPENPDLDQLRTQARELQRRVRAGEHAAAEGVGGEGPDFSLSRAQLALSRHYGFASWTRLRRHVDAIRSRSWTYRDDADDGDNGVGAAVADRFVRLACLSYSAADGDGSRRTRAAELLAAQPGLASSSLAAAVVAGDLDVVRERLRADPSAASAPTGPNTWSPLMYVAYGRFEGSGTDSVGIARLLLEHGAEVNDGRFFGGLASPFTVLTGVLGGGERDQPAHPQMPALARLLLEHNADANDAQALYNRQFDEDDTAFELLFEFGLGRGDGGPWRRLLPDLLASPTRLVRRLLRWAVVHDQQARVAMLAAHGVDLLAPLGSSTPIALALRNGHVALADRLRALGATEPQLDPVERFVAAALAGDRDSVAAASPDVLAAAREQRAGLPVWAAAQGRPGAVELLIEVGFDIDVLGRADVPVEQPWQTALHTAVEQDDIGLVRRLLELGADRTIHDARFEGTAADWAEHFGRHEIAALFTDG